MSRLNGFVALCVSALSVGAARCRKYLPCLLAVCFVLSASALMAQEPPPDPFEITGVNLATLTTNLKTKLGSIISVALVLSFAVYCIYLFSRWMKRGTRGAA